MKKSNIVLIYLLVLILILNAVLLYYLYTSSNKLLITKINNFLPILKNNFIIEDPLYLPLTDQFVIIKSENHSNPSIGTALFKGVVNGNLIFNKETGFYSLPIKIHNAKGYIYSNLIIGPEKQIINIRLAKKGLISNGQSWKVVKPAEIKKYIKKNNPLIINIYYDQSHEGYNYIKNQASCNTKCKLTLNTYQKYSKNSEKVFNFLSSNKVIEESLSIGPTQYLIIYVN